MDTKESEQYYRSLSEDEKIFWFLNYDEALSAIQDEVLHLAVSGNVSEEVHEVLDRVEALARNRYDFSD